MNTQDLQNVVMDAIDGMKAQHVTVLDVKAYSPMFDTMVICTGTSTRHVKSISDNLVKITKTANVPPLSIAGNDSCEWVLVDLNSIIVHIMLESTREFYQLEKLWTIPEPSSKPE